MPKYALCAELKEGCRDQYIEIHHHATVTQRLRDINRKAGVTKEQVRRPADLFSEGSPSPAHSLTAMQHKLGRTRSDCSAVLLLKIFLFGNLIFLYGECEDVDRMNAVLAADGLAAQWCAHRHPRATTRLLPASASGVSILSRGCDCCTPGLTIATTH